MRPFLRIATPSPIPIHSHASDTRSISEKSSWTDSSGSQDDTSNPHTPLLPPSPGMLEGGGYFGEHSRQRRGSGSGSGMVAWLRSAVGANGKRGAGYKRLLWIVVMGLVVLTITHRHSVSSGEMHSLGDSTSTSHLEKTDSSKFKLPALFPFSNSRPGSSSGSAPAAHHASQPVSYTRYDLSRYPEGMREIDIASEQLDVDASLRERLDAWIAAPGGRGEVEGEVELGGFNQWNLEECSTIHEQHNTHMIQKSANIWGTMNRTTLHATRMELVGHMEGVLARGDHLQWGEGRGIVMVAGNADTLQRVKWSLMMLRSYGSKLPVQIFHFPSERPPADDPIRKELKDLGAELVEAVGQQRDKGKNKSYHLKAMAVVQCPWREVLYLDSDSIPTRDPSYMFEAPNYQRLGLWATPDYWKTSANNPIWAIIGVKCRNEWEMETGQMFIDKQRHLDAFLLIQYMLERHDTWFYFSDGDKDLYRWAFLALRKRWGVPGRWVGAAALPSGTASGEFCSHTMLQHDSWGEPLFVHYNLLKQIPSGVGRGFSWGRTKQLPLFNLFPATPSTARLGEPVSKPEDEDAPGLGDVDCDMLADADEMGRARAPAKEMIMRRAVRERGVKVRYHGGWISALCIDLDYIDPRPEERKDEDKQLRELREAAEATRKAAAEQAAQQASDDSAAGPSGAPGIKVKTVVHADGTTEVAAVEEEIAPALEAVYPDWEQSPIEVVQWSSDPHLREFEKKLYDFGFKPSGEGF